MEEIIFTGYCRALDQSRIVEAEMVSGKVEADCAYPDCPHATVCLIAQQLKAVEP